MNPVSSRWVAVLAGAATVLATVGLGRWQLQRADEKLAAASLVQRRATEPAWSNADWPCAKSGPAPAAGLPEQRPARLRGHWMSEHTVFLDNRPMDGSAGFDVVTPLRVSSGPCQGRVVLVQRGWVPRDARDRQHLPTWQDVSGEVLVPGRVLAQTSRAYALGEEPLPPRVQDRSTGPLIRQNTEADFWQAWLGQAPLVGALLQTDDEVLIHAAADVGLQADVPPALALLRHWPAPDAGVGKHLAYAAQWFAMSAVAACLTLWFQFIRPRWRAAHPAPVTDPSASHT